MLRGVPAALTVNRIDVAVQYYRANRLQAGSVQLMNTSIRLAEVLGALSHALDLTEGQPPGHCVRCCWIGVKIGRQLGLPEEQLRDLYYTLLLKDLAAFIHRSSSQSGHFAL
jgi:HD-GYP domain-containing protein (c-di-GMP phosphodiesterase class II)